jgi:hypothetical protein
MALVTAACQQGGGGQILNVPVRTYLREVYHTSPLTIRAEFNVGVVGQVWTSTNVQVYDTFPSNQYLGELDSCGIGVHTFPALPLSPPEYTLVEDSGWIVTQVTANGTVVSGDALYAFYQSRPVGDSTIPVFMFPRLIELRIDGSWAWRGVQALAFPFGAAFPSVWVNTREPPVVASTLAHELGHLFLEHVDPATWTDNSTPFLYVLTHIGQVRLHRSGTQVPGGVVPLTATDVNRRFVIRLVVNDACILAKTNVEVVRPVLP